MEIKEKLINILNDLGFSETLKNKNIYYLKYFNRDKKIIRVYITFDSSYIRFISCLPRSYFFFNGEVNNIQSIYYERILSLVFMSLVEAKIVIEQAIIILLDEIEKQFKDKINQISLDKKNCC